MSILTDLIEKRRTIRRFQPKKVPHEDIEEIVKAARLAPSGCNAQPSLYYIVESAESFQKLRENNVFSQEFVYNAPCLIVCCGDPGAYQNPEAY